MAVDAAVADVELRALDDRSLVGLDGQRCGSRDGGQARVQVRDQALTCRAEITWPQTGMYGLVGFVG